MNPPRRLFSFVGGNGGAWRVLRQQACRGAPWPGASHVEVVEGDATPAADWVLRGITSHDRYVQRPEKQALAARQQGLGRTGASCAALIPIRKSAAWWVLTQEERRRVFEEQSQHIAIGMMALPAVSRRLHHCRDLSEAEPFDFLTWFEYAPADEAAFDNMLEQLRRSLEWQYVEREVDIRLARVPLG